MFSINFISFISYIIFALTIFADDDISPYKIDNFESLPSYIIPESSRFTVSRPNKSEPDIIYYLSKPEKDKAPITIFVTGSSSKDSIYSVIHVHRHFLKEVFNIGSAMLTIEQWGIDNDKVNIQEFLEHYTRSQRYQDHKLVIENLKINPPDWWNEELILIGVSEGGLLVTNLAAEFSDIVVVSMNWCGASDLPWRDELWQFIQINKIQSPPLWWKIIHFDFKEYNNKAYTNRQEYDILMDNILVTPVSDQEFMGMAYKYHADAMEFPKPDYAKLTKPFLVVAGAQDSTIDSSDTFVSKAKLAGSNITYLRIEDMDHYIRKRPDVINKSFHYLSEQLKLSAD